MGPGCLRQTGAKSGFTLIEILIALAILGVLAAIALPKYTDYREKVRIEQAKWDIRNMEDLISQYFFDHRALPLTLGAATLFVGEK